MTTEKLEGNSANLVGIGEAARILKVSKDTIRRWEREGILSSIRPDGKNRRFLRTDLEDFINAKPLTVTEAAQRIGVSASTLRRLEDKGILIPERGTGGRRLYSTELIKTYLANGRASNVNNTVIGKLGDAIKPDEAVIYPLKNKPRIVPPQRIAQSPRIVADLSGIKSSANKPLPDIKSQSGSSTSKNIWPESLFPLKDGHLNEKIDSRNSSIEKIVPSDKRGGFFARTVVIAGAATAAVVAMIVFGFLVTPGIFGEFFGLQVDVRSSDNNTNVKLMADSGLARALTPLAVISLDIIKSVSPSKYTAIIGTNVTDNKISINSDGTISLGDVLLNNENTGQVAADTSVVLSSIYLGPPVGSGTPTLGNIFVGDSQAWQSVALSGDFTLSGSGVANIVDGAVDSAAILNASILAADIAPGAVTSAGILDGTIVVADIATGAVTTAKILDGTVVTVDLADGAITSAKIGDGEVKSDDIAEGAVGTSEISDGSIVAIDIASGAIISAKIANDAILEAHLKAVDTAADEECLTYESTTGDFEWQTCGAGGSGSLDDAYDNGASITVDAADILFDLNDSTNDYGLVIDNNTAGTIDTGLEFTSGGGGTLTTAILASAAEITNAINIGANIILGTTGVIDFTDFDVAATGQVTIAPDAALTTAIDLTDADIVNAISVAANTILGTTGNIDFTNFDVIGSSGDITTAGDLAVNGGDITASGDLTINPAGGQVLLADTDVLNIGGITGLAYNAISDSGTTSNGLASDDDLYVEGDFEVDGTLYADGGITASDLTCTDCLDFADFEDTMDLDAALTLNQGTNTWTQNFTGTTTTGLAYNANSLTTGKALDIRSNSADTSDRSLVYLENTNTLATNVIVLDVRNNATDGLAIYAETSGDIVAKFVRQDDTDTASILDLRGDRATPSDNDLAKILFQLNHDGTIGGVDNVVVAEQVWQLTDVSENSEDGLVYFTAVQGSTLRNVLSFGFQASGTGSFVINEDSVDMDFRVEGDTDIDLFYLDAGNNRIGISDSTPDALFDIENSNVNQTALLVEQVVGAAQDAMRIVNNSVAADALEITVSVLTTGNAIDIPSLDALTTGNGIRITSGSEAISSGELLNIDLVSSGSANTAKTGNLASIIASRTDTRTSGTTADDYDLFNLSRTTIQNGAGGTTTAAGSVLRIENIATQTAGTLTDTVNILELVQSASSSGDVINIDANGTGQAIDIVADNTTTNVINVTADAVTTGDVLFITADALTSGRAIYIQSTSADATARNLVDIHNTAGANARLLFLNQDANNQGLEIDSEATTATVLTVDGNKMTSGNIFEIINAGALTTGRVINILSTSTDAGVRTLVNVQNDSGANATVMNLDQDGDEVNLSLNTDGEGTSLNIDSEAVTSNVIAINADPTTTGNVIDISADGLTSGRAIYIQSTSANATARNLVDINNTAGANATLLFLNQDADEVAINIDSESTTNDILNISAAPLTTGNAIDIPSLDALTTGNGIRITSGSEAISSGELLNIDLVSSGSANTAKTGNLASIIASRTDTRTSGTTADDYDLFNLSRTTIQNGAGGTTTAAGSVLRIENIATQTAGTLTDTVILLELVQDADSSGAAIDIQNSGTGRALNIDQSGEGVAMKIDAGGVVTSNILEIEGGALTTGDALNLTANALTTGRGAFFSSTSFALSSGELLRVDHGNEGSFTESKTGNLTIIRTDREHEGAANISDSFDLLKLEKSSTKDGASGTYDTAGNILNINQVSSGLDSDSTTGLLITMASGGTGDAINIDANGTGQAIKIDAENTTTDVVYIDANLATTGRPLVIDADGITTAAAVDINVGSNAMTSGAALSVGHSAIAITADKTGSMVNIITTRQNTAAAARSDDYDELQITRTIDNTNAGGSLTSTGSLIRLENSVAQTAGTTTDTTKLLELIQDADSSGDVINIDANGTGQAIDIVADNTTTDVIDITADAVTTGNVIDISADGLTTGMALNIISTSASASGRELVHLESTTGTDVTTLRVINGAGNGQGLQINTSGAIPIKAINEEDSNSALVGDFRGERATPGDGDQARFTFQLQEDGGDNKEYARLTWVANDVSSGTEDGSLIFSTAQGGTLRNMLDLGFVAAGTGNVVINEDGVDVDFRVEGVTDTDLFYVNAGTNRIGISDSTPDALFDIENSNVNETALLVEQVVGSAQNAMRIINNSVAADALEITVSVLTTGNAIDIPSLDALTTGNGIRITSGSEAISSGELLNIDLVSSGSANTAKTGNLASIVASRTDTRTSGTTADDYDLFNLSRTTIQNGAGGTTTAAGSVLRIENIATQTAGTLTDTVQILELVQSANSSGDVINIDANGTGQAIDIVADNTTTNIVNVTAASLTTGSALNIDDVDSLTTGSLINLSTSSGNTAMTSGRALEIDFDSVSAVSADKTGSFVLIQNQRDLGAGRADNYDLVQLTRISNYSAGSPTSQGSVLRILTDVESGITDTTNGIEIEMDADGTGKGMEVDHKGNGIVADFIASGGTTANAVQISGTSLTSGDGLQITVDSDTLTTGRAIQVIGASDAATEVFYVDGLGNTYVGNFATGTGNTTAVCWDNSGGSTLVDCDGAPTDLAENFGSQDNSIEAGEIVAIDTSRNGKIISRQNDDGKTTVTSKAWIVRASAENANNVLGVISTTPNQLFGDDGVFEDDENPRPVSLAGRVPVKVNNEGGDIAVGDRITISSTPGVGMKAGADSIRTIGIALEALADGADTGTILVFIDLQEKYDTQLALSDDASLAKLKSNVSSLSLGLDALMLLNAREFDWNDDGRHDIGFIAEEVEAVNPLLASYDGEGNLRGVKYSKLTALLTKGIQEQQGQIASLAELVGVNLDSLLVENNENELQQSLLAQLLDLQGRVELLENGSGQTTSPLTTLNQDGDVGEVAGASEEAFYLTNTIFNQALSFDGALKVNNNFTVIGELEVHSDVSLYANLIVDTVHVANGLFVNGDTTLFGNLLLEGDADIQGELSLSDQQAGLASIPRGGIEVKVKYPNVFKQAPLVQVTPVSGAVPDYWVTETDQDGFTIRLAKLSEKEIRFSWLTLSVEAPKVAEGEAVDKDGNGILDIDESDDGEKNSGETSTPINEPKAEIKPGAVLNESEIIILKPTATPTPTLVPIPPGDPSIVKTKDENTQGIPLAKKN